MAEEALGNIRTVKAFACEEHEAERYRVYNLQAYRVGVRTARYQAVMTFFTSFSLYGSMGGIIYYGAVLNERGLLTVGDISSFLLYMV